MKTLSASHFEHLNKRASRAAWWPAIKRCAVLLVLVLSVVAPHGVHAAANPTGSTGPGPGQTTPPP